MTFLLFLLPDGTITGDISGTNGIYQNLLPHDAIGQVKGSAHAPSPRYQVLPKPVHGADGGAFDGAFGGSFGRPFGDHDTECVAEYCEWAAPMATDHVTGQKVEPKVFFANERTFIKWLEMAVTLSSIAIAILAFSSSSSQSQYYAMMLLPISLLFIAYALWTFLWRSERIRTRDVNRWDDPAGPVILTLILISALTVQFFLKLSEIMNARENA